MKTRTLFSAAAIALLPTLAFVGCDDDDDNPTGPSTSNATVLVVHASPDAPPVDVLVNGAEVDSNLTFPGNTGYLTLPAGTYNVDVNVANTTTTAIDTSVTVSGNTHYSVFAVDSVSRIEALVLVDDLSAPAAGNAKVRFVHLSPNAPGVDVNAVGVGTLFNNQFFRDATTFSEVPGGTYNINVTDTSGTTTFLPVGNVTFNAGQIYTVFARGFVGGAGNQALNAEVIVNQ